MDFSEVKTKNEIYDLREAKRRNKGRYSKVARKRKGYKGFLTAYLFKINYNDTVKGYLNECFLNEKKINVSNLDKIFTEVYSPIEYIISSIEEIRIQKIIRYQRAKEIAWENESKKLLEVWNKIL